MSLVQSHHSVEQTTNLLAHGNEFELVRQRKHAKQFELRHARPQVLVVYGHRVVCNVVVGRDPT